MKTGFKIIKTDWFLDKEKFEGTVSFLGKKGGVIQAFSQGQDLTIGQELTLELSSLLADLQWEVVFSENKQSEIKLVRVGDWEYEAYGKIISINPVVVDFGEFELDTDDWTNDKNVTGEYIYMKIDRLDI